MNEDTNIPLEWQPTPFYDASVFWMARHPRPRSQMELEMDAEILESPDLEPAARERIKTLLETPQQEVIPGWYFQIRVTFSTFNESLEEARQLARDRIRGWNMRPILPFFGAPQEAPVWLTKSERRKLLAEFDATPLLEPSKEDEERYFLRFYKELGEAALGIEIHDASHHTEFETVTGAPNDPLKTLVGRRGTLSALGTLEMDEWEVVSEGIVALEGNTLRVGNFQLEVVAGDVIHGTAFDTAYWEESGSGKSFEVSLDPRDSG
jgi:hypothetical protein